MFLSLMHEILRSWGSEHSPLAVTKRGSDVIEDTAALDALMVGGGSTVCAYTLAIPQHLGLDSS